MWHFWQNEAKKPNEFKGTNLGAAAYPLRR
jgi:hypothetical protein